MNRETGLERRYRRLLAWYPAGHRRDHGEEMLGFLLAAARPGQRRPGLAEAGNLLWGGLLIRLRASLRDHSDPRWRDALAVTSVAAPLALLGVQLLQIVGVWGELGSSTPFLQVMVSRGIQVLVPLVLACLVLCRLRRTAIGVTLVLPVYLAAVSVTAYRFLATAFVAFYLLFGALEVTALIASDGPRRGLEILTWPRRVMVVAGGVAAAAIGWGQILFPWAAPAALALSAAVLVVLALLFPVARRVLVLLAIPACPAALAYAPASLVLARAAAPAAVSLLYLPPLLLAGVALAAASRSRRRMRGSGGHTPAGSGGQKTAS